MNTWPSKKKNICVPKQNNKNRLCHSGKQKCTLHFVLKKIVNILDQNNTVKKKKQREKEGSSKY